MQNANRVHLADLMTLPAHWVGGSGREYAAVSEPLEAFHLDEGSIYVLVDGNLPHWVGSSRDLIEDQASRARFRLAMQRASNVLRFSAPNDDVERMVLKFDLEGGRQVYQRDAA